MTGSLAQRRWRVLGIMSGTSLDGVDAVLVECHASSRPAYVRHWSRRFPKALRLRLLEAAGGGGGGAWELGQLHHDLGRFYAAMAVNGLEGQRVDAVGLHGQTVYHRPHPTSPATWQIGEPAYLAEALRAPVVGNFRAADLAAGGEGAPLATLFHLRVFGRKGRHVCVHNLGGISNVTSIDARDRSEGGILAFDTGPANLLLDLAVARGTRERRRMDRDGRLARQGTPEEGLLRRWLRHPFFRKPPPKSTGREEFGVAFLERCWTEMDGVVSGGAPGGLSLVDRLATLSEFTARSVAFNYRRHLPAMPDEVVFCGGGALNRDLVARLSRALGAAAGGPRCVSCLERGWPVEAIEGAAFALLAHERLRGRAGQIPQTTGAHRPVRCGQVADGRVPEC